MVIIKDLIKIWIKTGIILNQKQSIKISIQKDIDRINNYNQIKSIKVIGKTSHIITHIIIIII